jgi:hypothetical protein
MRTIAQPIVAAVVATLWIAAGTAGIVGASAAPPAHPDVQELAAHGQLEPVVQESIPSLQCLLCELAFDLACNAHGTFTCDAFNGCSYTCATSFGIRTAG